MTLVLTAAAANVSLSAPPRSYYQLEQRAQELVEALASRNALAVYRMFIPAFRDQHSYPRLDSAIAAWSSGRTVAQARSRVIDIRGIGGHVSSWIVFEGESDYSYIYQSWLYADAGWQLLWLSRILDQSFTYGNSDRRGLDAIRRAALERIATRAGLAAVRPGLRPPPVIIAVQEPLPTDRFQQIEGVPVLWLTLTEARRGWIMPPVDYFFQFALVRDLGRYATAAVDIRPRKARKPGRLGRRRGVQVYLEKVDGDWQFHSIGKIW